MSTNRSIRLWSVTAAFLAFAFGASPAIATEILEVQVDPADPPQFLVIYGTDFGTVDAMAGTPLVNLGTQDLPLAVSADQSACTPDGTAPPLDDDGIDCVVVDLPHPTPDGDYLLWLEAGGTGGAFPACSCADGKPQQLIFEYTGDDCTETSNNPQEGKFECSGDPAGAAPVQVVCDDGDCSVDPDTQTIIIGGELTLNGSGGKSKKTGSKKKKTGRKQADKFDKFGSETNIQIIQGGTLQYLNIHTSCSKPLAVGDQFGSLLLVGFIPQGGSEHCAAAPVTSAHYDLTIGGGTRRAARITRTAGQDRCPGTTG